MCGMNFATLKGLTIPEGKVTKITDASGRVLWQSGVPVTITSRVDFDWPRALVTINDDTINLTPNDQTHPEVVMWDGLLPIGTELIFTNGADTYGEVTIHHKNGEITRASIDELMDYAYTVIGKTIISVEGGQRCEPYIWIQEQ